MLKIELGGGSKVREGWINIDLYSKTSNLKLDFRELPKMPFTDESVDVAFSSHFIEHINDTAFKYLLKELYRITKVGATLRFSCPDADLIYDAYINKNDDIFSVFPGGTLEERFVNWFVSYENQSGVRYVHPEKVKKMCNDLPKEIFLNWIIIEHLDLRRSYIAHCNWYNEEKLTSLLSEAGFKNIKRTKINESRNVELRHGFDGHKKVSVYMECEK